MTDEHGPEDPADAALRSLRSRARRSNLTRVAQLEAALHAAREGRLDDPGRRAAADVAHQVLGSAGTFGFSRASALAGRLEQLLLHPDLTDALFAEASEVLAALRHELGEAGPPGRADEAGPSE